MADPATMISPVFGLTLLGHLDIFIIIGAFIPGVIAGVIWITQRRLQQTQLRQQVQQVKVDSARLALELEREYRSEEFRLTAVKIVKDMLDLGDEDDVSRLDRYLNHVSLVCRLYTDGLITKTHMNGSFHNSTLALDEHEWSKQYIEENKDAFPDLYRYIETNRDRESLLD